MSYLDRIAVCTRWDPEAYRPFTIDGAALGRVTHGFARRLKAYPKVFTAFGACFAACGVRLGRRLVSYL